MKTLFALFLSVLLALPSFAAGTAAVTVNALTGQLNGPAPAAGVTSGFLVPTGFTTEFQSGSTLKIDSGATVTGLVATVPGGSAGQLQYNNTGAFGATTVSWNGTNLTGLASPVGTSDAATKAYVDSASAGLTVRASVSIATTANITLSGEQTIDGVLTSAARVLVKNQTLSQNNGIYTSGSGAWTRASDSNTAATLAKGFYYFVSSGTAQGSTSWTISTAPTTLGTDPVVFSQFSASQTYAAGVGLTLTGNSFAVNAAQSGITSVGTLTALSTSGVITSSIATGTAPLAVTSTTNVANLNASLLNGNTFADTGASGIGSGTPRLGIFAGQGNTGGEYFSGSANYSNHTNGAVEVVYTTGAGTILTFNRTSSAYEIMNVVGSTVNLQVNGATVVAVAASGTTTSGNSATSGTTSSGNFGTISFDTAVHERATKTNLNVILNVRDYGALGDGSTNDTAAINAAIAAMTSGSTLYFPAGKYLVTLGGITAFTTFSNITVMGDGRASQLYSAATGAAGSTYFLFFSAGCDHVMVKNLSLVGSATSRGSGGHGLICYASYSTITGLYITGTSDFGIYVSNGAGAYSHSISVTNCISDHTLGDGFHFGAVTDVTFANCQSYYTGDDGCGIGDDGAIGFPATRVEVTGFQSIQAGNHAGGGTHGAGIRIFDGAMDVHVTGCSLYQSCEAGITCGRFASTTAYNTRIKIDGVKVYQCLQTAGMYGQINLQFVNQGSITGCWSEAPVSQGCYAFLDCNNLVVSGNTAKDAVLRAFVTDDSTTTNVASTWSNWTFSSNICLGNPSNESYYFIPATGKTITNLMLIGNSETGQSATNYINTNRLAGVCKIVTNCSLGGKTITNGGSGSTPTSTPNY